MAVDPISNKVFVADTSRNRVLRYASAASLANAAIPEAVLGQPDFTTISPGTTAAKMKIPTGLAIDAAGRLWVADVQNHRILRFDNAASKSNGAPANGVLGQTLFTTAAVGTTASALNFPTGVAVSGGLVFVADNGNNRVLRFDNPAAKSNGTTAQTVFGQASFTSSASGLSNHNLDSPQTAVVEEGPGGLILWVADYNNKRVLGFANAGTPNATGGNATRVLGQTNFTSKVSDTTASTLTAVSGLAISGTNLYVSDPGNSRVLRWNAPSTGGNGTAADMVYGRPNFTSGGEIAWTGIYGPEGLWVDGGGNLWVTDAGHARVLRYNSAIDKFLGASYDLYLGAPAVAVPEIFATGIAIDPVTGKVFVADSRNNRVFRYAQYNALVTGQQPEAVLGQSDLVSNSAGTGATKMREPHGLAFSPSGRLWVADSGNHRILRFDNAWAKPDGAPADGMLGQTAFGVQTSGTGNAKLNFPCGVYLEPNGILWVADTSNNRVLRFDSAHSKPMGGAADGVLGQNGFAANAPQTTARYMSKPTSVTVGSQGRLWVMDANNNRVLRFENAAAKPNWAPADGVLGQTLFTTSDEGIDASRLHTSGPFPLASLIVDGVGRLYVGDQENARIIWFHDAANRPDGAPADGLLGQTSFTTSPLRVLSETGGMVLDPTGALWASDNQGRRAVRFSSTTPAVTAQSLSGSKKLSLTLSLTPGATYQAERSSDLKNWFKHGTTFQPILDFYFWSDPAVASGRHFFRFREVTP